jgi:hypothetical protein
MLRKLIAVVSFGLFAISSAAFAAERTIPTSPSEGALGGTVLSNFGKPDYKGMSVAPTSVPSSPSEGALGNRETAWIGQPMFEGTAALSISIPSSPSEGALR